jgi:hypothetical protein
MTPIVVFLLAMLAMIIVLMLANFVLLREP